MGGPLYLFHPHSMFSFKSRPTLIYFSLLFEYCSSHLESLNSHKRVLSILLPMITERNHIYPLSSPRSLLLFFWFFVSVSIHNSRSSFSMDVFFQLDCFLNANGWKCKRNCRIILTKWSWSNGKMPRRPVGKSRTPVNMHVRNRSFHWI